MFVTILEKLLNTSYIPQDTEATLPLSKMHKALRDSGAPSRSTERCTRSTRYTSCGVN